jgi:hypothetical protein
MAASVYVIGRRLTVDIHRRIGPHKKCRRNAGQLSVLKKNKFSQVKIRVKDDGLFERHRQLSRTFVPSERQITPSQVACCMHVLVVRGFAGTVLLNTID